jgi:hypothetical protein
MKIPMITVVAGPAGCGKTTWICEQLRNAASGDKVIYFSPGTGKVPIDQSRLKAEFPEIQVICDGEEAQFLSQVADAENIYIELGFYLELSTIEQIVGNVPYHAVAILPPSWENPEYQVWAEKVVTGLDIHPYITENQIWRSPTNGQVIDEDSLNEFWYELSHGAYGQVSRAKGIFDVADGRALYGDFVAGVPNADFLELDLPRHLEGRPQRFSGLEVWGKHLDEAAIKETLQDCYLSDAAIAQYQTQVKQILIEESIQ